MTVGDNAIVQSERTFPWCSGQGVGNQLIRATGDVGSNELHPILGRPGDVDLRRLRNERFVGPAPFG